MIILEKCNMLKTTNIEADMMAKRREHDRQLEWEEEYARRLDMDFMESEAQKVMMSEDKYDSYYENSYPSSRLDNRWWSNDPEYLL